MADPAGQKPKSMKSVVLMINKFVEHFGREKDVYTKLLLTKLLYCVIVTCFLFP